MIQSDAGDEKSKAQFRIIVDQESRLCCPACGDTTIHLGTTVIDQGHLRARAFSGQFEVGASDRYRTRSGSTIGISLFCECCTHVSLYQVEFEQGSISASLQTWEPKIGKDGPEWPAELWRC